MLETTEKNLMQICEEFPNLSEKKQAYLSGLVAGMVASKELAKEDK